VSRSVLQRIRGWSHLSTRTLRTKVAITLTVTIFAILIVATIARAIQDQQSFLADQTERGLLLAAAMANVIPRESALAHPEQVRAVIGDLVGTSGIAFVEVIDRTFSVIATAPEGAVGTPGPDRDLQEAAKHGTVATSLVGNPVPSILRVAVPIRDGERLVGGLELGFDLSANRADLTTFIRRSLVVAIIVAGATTFMLLWLLNLIVVRPVAHFASLSQELARGNFSVEFPPGGVEEVDQLGRALTRTRDSLRELSALWKDQNPLSGLPGNLAIDRVLRQRLDGGSAFAVLYADLDDFKAFNDRYGFDRGDVILRFTAATLQEALRLRGGAGDFLGHVGGDDFILVVDITRAETTAREAIHQFDLGVPTYYDTLDRQHASITTHDRQGREVRVPFASLTIVGTVVDGNHKTTLSIGEIAAELKAYAKRTPGSKFMMDRRVPKSPRRSAESTL